MSGRNASHTVASTLGVLVGIAGIDHGIFEILQGHTRPGDVMIAAIGPDQRFWEFGTETALTIIPSFLISGILSVLFGILVTIWAVKFLDWKYGPLFLLTLSTILFLVGGGFAPIFMALIASLTATRIHKPLNFWRMVLPHVVRVFLAKLWRGVLIAFVIVFVFSVVVAIFGWPLTTFFDHETAFKYLNTLSFVMVGLMLFSVVSGFAYDIQQQMQRE